MDTRTAEQRTAIMRAVRQRDTGPEMVLRRALHALGYRFRLHDKRLPGSPDLVFSRRKKVIFVHGCFWHGHGCRKGRLPKSRLSYWSRKIETNQHRDARVIDELKGAGWQTHVVWQCQMEDLSNTVAGVRSFLDARS